jgi:hypothetical protein
MTSAVDSRATNQIALIPAKRQLALLVPQASSNTRLLEG